MQDEAAPADVLPARHQLHWVAPVSAAFVIGGHAVHDCEPAVAAKCPGWHATHTGLAGGLVLPAEQATHLPPMPRRPASHAVQSNAALSDV